MPSQNLQDCELKAHGLPANKSIHGNIVRVAARRPESSGAGYQFPSHHSIFLKCVESATRAKFEIVRGSERGIADLPAPLRHLLTDLNSCMFAFGEDAMTFTIHASRNDQRVVTVRISPAVAVHNARLLENLGWHVNITH